MIGPEEHKKFYNTLDYFIIQRGMSRSALSKMCGKDITSLNPSKIKGKRWITVGFFLKICEVLGITPQQFFNKQKEM